MPQGTPNPNEAAEQQEAAPALAKKSKFAVIKIALFVSLIIGIECGAALFLLPDASATAASSIESKAEPKAEGKEKEKSKEKEKDKEKEAKHETKKTAASGDDEDGEEAQIEVDLGQFSVTAFQPATNTTLRIDFHLYGTVGSAEEKDFATKLEENQHRFRDQVIVTLRSSELSDLTDAGLGLIKRKIMDKTNRMFGKPLLRSVIFSDFSFIEQ